MAQVTGQMNAKHCTVSMASFVPTPYTHFTGRDHLSFSAADVLAEKCILIRVSSGPLAWIIYEFTLRVLIGPSKSHQNVEIENFNKKKYLN